MPSHPSGKSKAVPSGLAPSREAGPVSTRSLGVLNSQQRTELCGLIEARLHALQRQLAVHQEEQPRVEREREAFETDLEDAAQAASDRSVDRALFDIDTQEIDALEATRQRILAGQDVGLCQDCGSAIPWARLRAEPQAARCLACEARRERLRAAGG